MYTVVVFAIMLVFPILSILIEQALSQHGYMEAVIVGKWFVFWLVGVRLLLAGIRQILQPNYTAEKLLGIKDPASHLVVRETWLRQFFHRDTRCCQSLQPRLGCTGSHSGLPFLHTCCDQSRTAPTPKPSRKHSHVDRLHGSSHATYHSGTHLLHP